MNKLKFCFFIDCEDETMARMLTTGEHEIPFNLFVESPSGNPEPPKDDCYIDICGIGDSVEIYASAEEYQANNPTMAEISMIPMGSFALDPEDEGLAQSSLILFSGKVLDVEWNPPDADPDEVNCCALIETLGLFINLFFQCDKPLEKGYIVHGTAWLYSDLMPSDAGGE